MAATTTSVHSSAILDALAKSMEKLAEAEQPQVPPSSRSKAIKRALRTAGIAALGYSAGHAAGMVGDKILSKKFGEHWSGRVPSKVLIPIAGLTSAASAAIGSEIAAERERRRNG